MLAESRSPTECHWLASSPATSAPSFLHCSSSLLSSTVHTRPRGVSIFLPVRLLSNDPLRKLVHTDPTGFPCQLRYSAHLPRTALTATTTLRLADLIELCSLTLSSILGFYYVIDYSVRVRSLFLLTQTTCSISRLTIETVQCNTVYDMRTF